MDIVREGGGRGLYIVDCRFSRYIFLNVFLVEGRELRKMKKGIIESWYLNWVWRVDILVGRDLERILLDDI